MGTVRDGSGAPVAQARVYLAEGPGPFPDVAALTGADGRYSLSVAVPGRYLLECRAEGFAPASVRVEVAGVGPVPADIPLAPAAAS